MEFNTPIKSVKIPDLEKEVLNFWEKNKVFQESVKRNKDKPLYNFYDGPPFATGLPHYGHMLAGTMKDMVTRYFHVKGHSVPRHWGWDCFTGDTLITYPNGLAKRLDEISVDDILLCCDDTKASLLDNEDQASLDKIHTRDIIVHDNCYSIHKSEVYGFMQKGKQHVIQLTLADGRTIKCTPDHKILVKGGEWKKAQDLQLGWDGDMIIASVQGVYDEKTPDEADYIFTSDKHSFDMNIPEQRDQMLAYARLLGFMLSDGSLSARLKKRTSYGSTLYLGHSIDVNNAKADSVLVAGKSCGYNLRNKVYQLRLPASIARSWYSLEDVESGERIYKKPKWPKFILEDNCPKSVIREFLAGLFGGNGGATTYTIRKSGEWQNLQLLNLLKVPLEDFSQDS